MPLTEETRGKIIATLKKHLKKCTPPMKIDKSQTSHGFSLIGNKPVPYGYSKRMIPGMFFAAVASRKDSVTFHFFPTYMNPKLEKVAPSLYKCLKGKSCFHFRKEEQVNEKELDALLKKGMAEWKKAGYMK